MDLPNLLGDMILSDGPVFIPNFPSVEHLRQSMAELRTRENIKQKELGKLAGVSQSVVSRLIGDGTDRKKPQNVRYDEIARIAEALLKRALRAGEEPKRDAFHGVLVEEGRIISIVPRTGERPSRERPTKYPR